MKIIQDVSPSRKMDEISSPGDINERVFPPKWKSVFRHGEGPCAENLPNIIVYALQNEPIIKRICGAQVEILHVA